MTCYRERYPKLSVIARVNPSSSDPNGSAVVRRVWRADGSHTGHGGPVCGPQFYNHKVGWSNRAYLYPNPVYPQHRAQPPGHSEQRFIPRAKASWRGDVRNEKFSGGRTLSFGAGGGGGKNWFKMTIPHGKKYDKRWLLGVLQNHCPLPFRPLHYSREGHKVHFYVENAAVASALCKLKNRITDSVGNKVAVFMNPCCKPPLFQSKLQSEELEHLKLCMSKRFDGHQKCLDLNGICTDPDLVSRNIVVKLSRRSCMKAVLQIIEENIPELLCLDLSNNRLYRLNDFAELVNKAPSLQKLNLSYNELRSEQELDSLRGLELAELWLDRNPLCDHFEDRATYISAVRERFPRLLKLDGHVLPASICFDLDTSTAVPPCKGSYLVSGEIKKIIHHFLQHFYSVYDSGDRQQLLEVYHDGACFSLSLPVMNNLSRSNIGVYIEDGRNMKMVKDSSTRLRMLKHSRLTVVAFLNELPKTQHDISSFTVDVNTYTSSLLAFTVSGVFKEVNGRLTDIFRAFSRVFITVPAQTSGLCVVNDELYLRNATYEEMHRAFAAPAPPPPPSSSPEPTLSASQKEMLSAFSQQSEMNLEWSQKCLQDNAWDFYQAAQIFTELKAQGKIPEAAFIK